MKRPLPLKIAKALNKLANGAILPASAAKHAIVTLLIHEGIIFSKGKHRRTLQLLHKNELDVFLQNQLQISNLEKYIALLENENSNRSELVKTTSNSKTKHIRTFKGFLLNSYIPIKAQLNNTAFVINPAKGSFVFICNFETFIPPPHVTIVGIENAENFTYIRRQKYLFNHITPLFISRYPQNQNKDVMQWLKNIPNNYLHFGDFDMAGIGIYLNEYKKHLGQRAQFFIPSNIQKALRQSGNRERYNIQKINFAPESIHEAELAKLFQLIQNEQKGLDQEYFISEH